jgi:hypothetical protein
VDVAWGWFGGVAVGTAVNESDELESRDFLVGVLGIVGIPDKEGVDWGTRVAMTVTAPGGQTLSNPFGFFMLNACQQVVSTAKSALRG